MRFREKIAGPRWLSFLWPVGVVAIAALVWFLTRSPDNLTGYWMILFFAYFTVQSIANYTTTTVTDDRIRVIAWPIPLVNARLDQVTSAVAHYPDTSAHPYSAGGYTRDGKIIEFNREGVAVTLTKNRSHFIRSHCADELAAAITAGMHPASGDEVQPAEPPGRL